MSVLACFFSGFQFDTEDTGVRFLLIEDEASGITGDGWTLSLGRRRVFAAYADDAEGTLTDIAHSMNVGQVMVVRAESKIAGWHIEYRTYKRPIESRHPS